MKRRTYLKALGAGSIGTGALVGTSGFSEVRSQRRVKLEVGEKVDVRAISFIAFCPRVGEFDIDDEKVTIEIVATDEDGEPIEIRWTMPEGKTFDGELILKGVPEWYRFHIDGETGTARMGEGELLCDDAPSICQPPDEQFQRCLSSPCLNEEGTKFEAEDDFQTPETTRPRCPQE